MSTDVAGAIVSRLMDLPGVADSAQDARTCVDALLWDRRLGKAAQTLAANTARKDSFASAVIDGIDLPLPAWISGEAFDESPLGRAAAGVWRLESAKRELVEVWATAPLQALARMHALVAADIVTEHDQLGRPRTTDDVDDPLRIKNVVAHELLSARLNALMDIASGENESAVVEAALVHGELLALRPFGWGSGPIARMSMRLVMAHRGLDPDFLVMTDVGISNLGRPAYVDAIRGYCSGSSEDVARWLRFASDAIGLGAGESVAELDAIG